MYSNSAQGLNAAVSAPARAGYHRYSFHSNGTFYSNRASLGVNGYNITARRSFNTLPLKIQNTERGKNNTETGRNSTENININAVRCRSQDRVDSEKRVAFTERSKSQDRVYSQKVKFHSKEFVNGEEVGRRYREEDDKMTVTARSLSVTVDPNSYRFTPIHRLQQQFTPGMFTLPTGSHWFTDSSHQVYSHFLQFHTDSHQVHSHFLQVHTDSHQVHSHFLQVHTNSHQVHSHFLQVHTDSHQVHSHFLQVHTNSHQVHSHFLQVHTDWNQFCTHLIENYTHSCSHVIRLMSVNIHEGLVMCTILSVKYSIRKFQGCFQLKDSGINLME